MLEIIKAVIAVFVGIVSSIIMVFAGSPSPEKTPEIPKEVLIEIVQLNKVNKIENEEISENEAEKQIVEEKPKEGVETETEVVVPKPIKVTPGEGQTIEIIPTNPNPNFIDLIITIPPIQKVSLDVSEVNTKIRNALVNIICTSKQGGLLQPITGSGVVIDSRGVILTNAHIAQYYLLRNYITEDFLDCVIRTGSPARNKYRAKLLYISPSWVGSNYQKISQSNPKGTGENDFALLLINQTTQEGISLPVSFPSISPDTREVRPKTGESVVVAGYPAGFLGGTTIIKELYAVSTVTQIMDVFTFKENSLDLFSIGGNIAAQKGSSGGGVASLEGRLLGIVVTASDAVQTEDRDLRAITLSHINKSITADTGADLNSYLFGNLSAKAEQFNELFTPGLKFLLEGALTQ